jgi:hypothetical protein
MRRFAAVRGGNVQHLRVNWGCWFEIDLKSYPRFKAFGTEAAGFNADRC